MSKDYAHYAAQGLTHNQILGSMLSDGVTARLKMGSSTKMTEINKFIDTQITNPKTVHGAMRNVEAAVGRLGNRLSKEITKVVGWFK